MLETKRIVLNREPLLITVESNKVVVSKGNCIIHSAGYQSDKEKSKILSILNKEYNKDFKYIYIPIKEDIADKLIYDYDNVNNEESKVIFIDNYGISPVDIVAFIDSNEITDGFLKKYIPRAITYPKGLTLQEKKIIKNKGTFDYSYSCFAGIDYKTCMNDSSTGGLVPHHDISSSWNCLMSVCNNPTFGIIIKEYTI
jgi:hypothetical protein